MKKIIFPLLAAVALIGCTTTQKSTATGGVIGAAIGGIVGHQSDNAGTGAAIGAAAGALGGYVVGEKISQKMFCPVCGRVFAEDLKYCPQDGTELKVQEK